VARFEQTGQPQRRFDAFGYRAGSWPAARWVVVKADAHEQGTNRRVVVTNRPGAFVLPGAAYDEYAERGENENRNKELKGSLAADRLCDHRFMANYFRLYLHCLAANLLVRVRQAVADPLTAYPAGELPPEVLAGGDRRRYFNRRRDHDPLGEGHAQTWRMRLIKVAAEIVVSARRVLVRLSGAWPFLHHYRAVSCGIHAATASLALNTS
jgi:hypothetical protein